jgi:hypothetical protein
MGLKEDYYLQGVIYHRHNTPNANRQARDFFQAAIDEGAREGAEYGRAYGFKAYAELIAYLNDWDDALALPNIQAIAENGVRHGRDYETLWSLAAVKTYRGNFTGANGALAIYDQAIDLAQRGEAIGESLRNLRVEKADAQMFQGPEVAIREAIQTVRDQIAVQPRPWHFWTLGWAHYELGHYTQEDDNVTSALGYFERLNDPPVAIQKNIAACYAALRQTQKAKEIGRKILPYLPRDWPRRAEKWPHDHDRGRRQQRFVNHLTDALT